MQGILSSLPFNISLLILKPHTLKNLRRVSVLDIFEPSSRNFHPEGLFSTDIFGKVGEERRNHTFAYISLGVEIFHPTIYKELCSLKELYGKIMAGTAYAVFDDTVKDFIPASIKDGQTGFAFFVKHFPSLRFEERPSTSRMEKIRMINNNRNDCMIRELVVMPAGLRDFTVSESGKSEEDEINTLYRQTMSISNVVSDTRAKTDLAYLDATRFKLQQSVFNIYTYIIGLLEGDSKLIQSWWTRRNIAVSTRNVITSNVVKSKKLFDEHSLSPNDIVVGLYQYLMSTLPLSVNKLREVTQNVFTGINIPAKLINKKTLKSESVHVDASYYDSWVTQEGIERTFSAFEAEARRHLPVVVGEHYLALLYRDKKSVRIIYDIDEVPEGKNREFVTPITYAELYYMCVAKASKTLYGFTTRYPIINLGGVYPASIYLKTTVRSQSLKEVDGPNWEETGFIYNEFPVKGAEFVNSMSPSYVHLAALGADFDGDMMSLIVLFTEDSLEEIKELLQSADYYVDIHGEMNYSASDDISDLVFAELSV